MQSQTEEELLLDNSSYSVMWAQLEVELLLENSLPIESEQHG